MSQSDEHKNYFRYPIVCSCQPGIKACSLISSFKDVAATLILQTIGYFSFASLCKNYIHQGCTMQVGVPKKI